MIDSDLNNRLNLIGSGVLAQDAKAIIEFGDDVSGICDRYEEFLNKKFDR